MNTFGYVEGNPVGYFDFSGLTTLAGCANPVNAAACAAAGIPARSAAKAGSRTILCLLLGTCAASEKADEEEKSKEEEGKQCDAQKAAKAAKGTGKTVDDLIKGSTPGRGTKGQTNQRDRSGDFDQANEDFDGLNPKGVKGISGGRRGTLGDGRQVNVRNGSKDGRPTLEIQSGKKRIKFRFNN